MRLRAGKLEFCFARDTGIPIIPVIVQPKWKATAWLGLLTSSALWTPLHEPARFSTDVDSLIEIICKNGGLEGGSTGGQPQHTPPVVAAVAVEKLEALRIQHAVSTSANHATKIDGLAVVPGGGAARARQYAAHVDDEVREGVHPEQPQLISARGGVQVRRGSQPTPTHLGVLTRPLSRSPARTTAGGTGSASEGVATKVGAYGMGGIGQLHRPTLCDCSPGFPAPCLPK
eukprot:COSAG01_NODE_773_length_13704_cov_9.386843_18_plen_230_part_00